MHGKRRRAGLFTPTCGECVVLPFFRIPARYLVPACVPLVLQEVDNLSSETAALTEAAGRRADKLRTRFEQAMQWMETTTSQRMAVDMVRRAAEAAAVQQRLVRLMDARAARILDLIYSSK